MGWHCLLSSTSSLKLLDSPEPGICWTHGPWGVDEALGTLGPFGENWYRVCLDYGAPCKHLANTRHLILGKSWGNIHFSFRCVLSLPLPKCPQTKTELKGQFASILPVRVGDGREILQDWYPDFSSHAPDPESPLPITAYGAQCPLCFLSNKIQVPQKLQRKITA